MKLGIVEGRDDDKGALSLRGRGLNSGAFTCREVEDNIEVDTSFTGKEHLGSSSDFCVNEEDKVMDFALLIFGDCLCTLSSLSESWKLPRLKL